MECRVALECEDGTAAACTYVEGTLTEIITFPSIGVLRALCYLTEVMPKVQGFTVQWFENKRKLRGRVIPESFAALDRTHTLCKVVRILD